jgi:hypothetical protein
VERAKELIGPALRLGLHPTRVIMFAGVLLFACDGLVALAPKLRMGGVADSVAMVVALGMLRAVLRSSVRPGYLRALRDTWRGDDAKLQDVFGSIDTFLDLLVVSFVGTVLTTMSVVAGALPGLMMMFYAAARGSRSLVWLSLAVAIFGGIVAYLYAWLGTRFAEHAVVLEGHGPWRALSRAWRAANGRRVALAKVAVFGSLVELAGLAWGLMTFGWGVVLGVPVGRLASDYASLGQWLSISRALREEDSIRPPAYVARGAFA